MRNVGNKKTKGENRRHFFKLGVAGSGTAMLGEELVTRPAYAKDGGDSRGSPYTSPFIVLVNRLEQTDGRGPTNKLLSPGTQILRFDVTSHPRVPDAIQVRATLRELPGMPCAAELRAGLDVPDRQARGQGAGSPPAGILRHRSGGRRQPGAPHRDTQHRQRAARPLVHDARADGTAPDRAPGAEHDLAARSVVRQPAYNVVIRIGGALCRTRRLPA